LELLIGTPFSADLGPGTCPEVLIGGAQTLGGQDHKGADPLDSAFIAHGARFKAYQSEINEFFFFTGMLVLWKMLSPCSEHRTHLLGFWLTSFPTWVQAIFQELTRVKIRQISMKMEALKPVSHVW
jgi:hypothetical protein